MNNLQRLKCGQLWQRINLWLTTQEIATQPLNQMCERADRESQLNIEPIFATAIRDLIDVPGWEGIMPFRIGYPTREARLSPRRDLEMVSVNA